MPGAGGIMGLGRRDFLTLLAGGTMMRATSSVAQPSGRTATIGFLMGLADDPEARGRAKTL